MDYNKGVKITPESQEAFICRCAPIRDPFNRSDLAPNKIKRAADSQQHKLQENVSF